MVTENLIQPRTQNSQSTSNQPLERVRTRAGLSRTQQDLAGGLCRWSQSMPAEGVVGWYREPVDLVYLTSLRIEMSLQLGTGSANEDWRNGSPSLLPEIRRIQWLRSRSHPRRASAATRAKSCCRPIGSAVERSTKSKTGSNAWGSHCSQRLIIVFGSHVGIRWKWIER